MECGALLVSGREVPGDSKCVGRFGIKFCIDKYADSLETFDTPEATKFGIAAFSRFALNLRGAWYDEY